MLDPIACADCGAEFTPRNRVAKRCPECAAKRRKSGQPESERNRRRADSGREDRNSKMRAVRWWGIDGEGVTRDPRGVPCSHDTPGARHVYTYMCAVASDGEMRELWRGGRRLYTDECLMFLWTLGKRGDKYAFYSSSYDWTHILIDLELDELRSIFKPERAFEVTWCHGWGITHLKNIVELKRDQGDREKAPSQFITDMFRCFAAIPFVDFIEKWQTGTPEERATIAAMKLRRGELGDMPDEQVHAYCQLECKHLAEAAAKYWQAMITLNMVPPKLYSAGSLAKALFRSWDIRDYRGPDRFAGAPEELRTVLMRGYFGARVELAEPGPHPMLHQYDLTNAYPAILAELPCLAHGRWEHHDGPLPERMDLNQAVSDPTIVHLSWKLPDGTTIRDAPTWGPLPWRQQNGGIQFPWTGEGWYWRAEVETALDFPPYVVTQHEYWTFVTDCDHRPFRRIYDKYAERQRYDAEWKAAGHSGKSPEGMAIKTALASCYGTTADMVSEDTEEHPSPFPSTVWAGMTTAGTRARCAAVLARHGSDTIAVATDAVYTRHMVLGDQPGSIGQWGYEGPMPDAFFIQPGLRISGRDMSSIKTRGVSQQTAREQDIFGQARRIWDDWGWDLEPTYSRDRLIPAKQALSGPDPELRMGQWTHVESSPLSFKSAKRQIVKNYTHRKGTPRPAGRTRPYLGWPGCSAPYSKLLSLVRKRQEEQDRRDAEQCAP